MSLLFAPPFYRAFDSAGVPVPGAFISFYATQSSTLAPIYADSTLAIALTNPVRADGNGVFPSIWLNDSIAYKYVIQLPDSDDPTIPGVVFRTGDPYNVIAAPLILHPLTQAETDSGITPVDFTYPAYTFLRYGLDPTGVADSTSAINEAFVAAAAAGHSKVTVGLPGAKVRVDGNIQWPVDKVGCDWQGSFLDCTRLSAGYTLNPTATFADPTSRVGLISAHPMENFTAQGPCTQLNYSSYSTTGFINFAATGSVTVIAGITIRNGGSWNFYTHANYGTGAFFESFENWAFNTVTATSGAGYSSVYLNMPVATEVGERNSFLNCFFGPGKVLQQDNNNADTYFLNCSIDSIGSATRLMTINNGACYLDNCHLEASVVSPASTGDTDYWIYVDGHVNNSTTLAWNNLTIVVDGDKPNKPIFYCDDTLTAGGISMGTTYFVNSSLYPQPLIGGNGNVVQAGPMFVYIGGTIPYYIANSLNALANGNFAGASFANDGWTTSGGTTPTLVNSPLPSSGATNVIKFSAVTGQTNVAKIVKTCFPGQIVSGQMWIRTDNLTGSNGVFDVKLSYLDTAGNVLKSVDVTFPAGLTTTQDYKLMPINVGGGGYVRAPAGTANYQLQMICNTTGTVSGTPFAYVGGVVINIQ